MSGDVRQPHGSASCACLFCWHDIATLTADLAAERAEVERLRAAGDALAERLNLRAWWPKDHHALNAWQEARRER